MCLHAYVDRNGRKGKIIEHLKCESRRGNTGAKGSVSCIVEQEQEENQSREWQSTKKLFYDKLRLKKFLDLYVKWIFLHYKWLTSFIYGMFEAIKNLIILIPAISFIEWTIWESNKHYGASDWEQNYKKGNTMPNLLSLTL